MPRKKFAPTAKQRANVLAMAGCGIGQDEIAFKTGCDPKTLRKYFKTELETGATIADMAVASNLLRFATGKKGTHNAQVRAAIFWLQCRRKWQAPQQPKGDPADGPKPGDLSDAAMQVMSDEELYTIARGERQH